MTTTLRHRDYLSRHLINPDPGTSAAVDYLGRSVGPNDTDFLGRSLAPNSGQLPVQFPIHFDENG